MYKKMLLLFDVARGLSLHKREDNSAQIDQCPLANWMPCLSPTDWDDKSDLGKMVLCPERVYLLLFAKVCVTRALTNRGCYPVTL